jgi:hypothetical protein
MATIIALLVLQFNVFTIGSDTTKPTVDCQTQAATTCGGIGAWPEK